VFAANLKAAREARGLSQEELAKLAQVYRCRIDTVERGERNIDLDNILRLADALGIEPGELLWKACGRFRAVSCRPSSRMFIALKAARVARALSWPSELPTPP
jgi:transcriptional regulator with XRE-family HTH domain